MKTSLLRLIVLAAAISCLSLPLSAQSSHAINRVVAPIDETSLVTLKGNVHPMAQARYDRGPAPVSTPTGRIMLMLQRSTSQQLALTQYLADLQNPSSPNYHKWLTPAQYGALYGISDSDLQMVEDWLQGHGFTIEKVPQARNVIEFSGNFGQLQSAFHTSMHSLVVNGQNHVANMTDPQIPAALAPVIAGVGPLNDFHPKPPIVNGPRGHFDAASKRIVPDFTLLDSNNQDVLFVVPADASTIYDTPNSNLNGNFSGSNSYNGTGISVGIAGTSDLNLNDVTNYRTAFLGETTTNVNLPTVVVDGNDPGVVSGWAVEALLDNEVLGGMAPKATVYFYTGADTDLTTGFVDAAYRALDDNTVSILSMSIEQCEASLGQSGNLQAYEGEQQAAAQGISVIVAAGDDGSAGCDNFDTETQASEGFNVNGFATPPYAVAVGGTDYDALATAFSTYVGSDSSASNAPPYYRTAISYIPENPWNDSTTVNTTLSANVATENNDQTNIVAGSGGFSSCVTSTSTACTGGYPVPAFQTGITPSGGVTNSNSVRMIPDVAFMAGDGFYYAAWALCSDPTSDGSTQSYTDCENNNGVFLQGSSTTPNYIESVGGTSAAAPAFAGMLALVAQAEGSSSDNYRLGDVNYVLYPLAASSTTYASVFHDVTVGNNSVVCASDSPNCGTNGFMEGYNAGTNYDLASGLGSVDVTALVKNWGNLKFGSTATTLNINGSTAAYTGTHGASLTFNVGVSPTTATGNAAIIDTADETSGGTGAGLQNNGQIAVPLANGAGSVQYNGLPGGTYTVYARYGGDGSNAASTSTGVNVTISPEASTTVLQVNAYNPQTDNSITSLTSIPYGSVILADAQIEGTAEGQNTQGTATGAVTFDNGSTMLGTANVNVDDLASYPPLSSSFVAFAPGSYSVTAAYSGDASFKSSTSSAVPFTVVKGITTAAAVANPTTVSSGGSTTITATLETPLSAGALPTGTVALTVGSNTVTINLSTFAASETTIGSTAYLVLTGTGSVPASDLVSGTNTINVTYSGDTNYATSTTSLTVTGPSGSSGSPSISLSSSGNISVDAGNTGTSTITVTPGGGFTGAVNLTCAVTTSIVNPNDPPTCSITSPVTISGTTAATSTMTIGTVETTGGSTLAEPPLGKFFLGGGATLALLFFFGVPARRRAWRAALSVVAILFVAGAIGCGGGSKTTTTQGTTPGTYTATVTGADAATGKITSSVAVTITVTQLAP
jgi:trimeric autotransporter adhesin